VNPSGPDLSVVIPTFRKPHELERTLAALEMAEAPEAWEVLVVDDGSGTGSTAELLARFDGRLPVIDASLTSNRGRAGARNHGWRRAVGSTVLFLDDDIVLEAGALRAHLRAQRRAPGVYLGDVVHDPAIVDSVLFDYLDSRGIAKTAPGEPCPARYFLTQNASLPRTALEAVGGFDEGFSGYGFEDMEIAFRLETRLGLGFFHLEGAQGLHVHHHRIGEYLAKKQECGRSSLPRIARLQPDRVGEMHLDVLPTLRTGAPWARRLEGALVDLLADTGLHWALQWKLEHFGRWMPRAVRHRLFDALVLVHYARGLRHADPAKMTG
jgi:glycosyltransferase involved in cell wall biosynthesis